MSGAHGGGEREFLAVRIAVLTVSDSRDEQSDKSGRLLVERLTSAGHRLAEKAIVPDDVYRIRAVVSRWIADPDVDVVITTGGTGVTGRDGTPEAVAPLLDKVLDGFGEMFRSISYADIRTSTLQSRALAGVANGTYVFCVPGSSGACATAWDELIAAQLDARTRPCNLVELMPRLREK
ncbi:MAG TPA: molybdenum cofactor biosynthesis protein B [Steroidobacteraceae bacterium]|nr:molybdenum cofactor biosynthesis protein B [Steroidobacteraceae bacterium]